MLLIATFRFHVWHKKYSSWWRGCRRWVRKSIQLLWYCIIYIALAIWDDCKYKEVGKKKPEKDFVKLNRLAAQSGLTTAHEQTQFRACNDIRRPSEEEERERRKSQHIIPEDMVFGISTRYTCTWLIWVHVLYMYYSSDHQLQYLNYLRIDIKKNG